MTQPSDRVQTLINSMTLEEKAGQIFVFTWSNQAQAHNDLRLHPGGFVRIYSDVLSIARDSVSIQSKSKIPLIIAADFERGIGGTVGGALETVSFMALGATNDENAAHDVALMIAREATSMGINMNYAPVLDINCNPDNPVINTRSFGGDPQLVARLGVAFMQGQREGGLVTCGKHFPGHGNTSFDSHSRLGGINGTRQELDRNELLPFKALIEADVDSIMSAHLTVPALDPDGLPATLSKRIMTDLLRGEFGFTGVAISDALDMGAVAKNYPPNKAIPMAVNAGCDQLIMPNDNAGAVNILIDAVRNGDVDEPRLNEAVTRILSMKENRGILDAPLPKIEKLYEDTFVPEHRARAREIAVQSITVLKDDGGHIPLKPDEKVFCVSVANGNDGRGAFLEPRSFADYLATDGRRVNSHIIPGGKTLDLKENPELWKDATNSDIIVIAAYVSVRLYSGTIDLPQELANELSALFDLDKPVVLLSFGSPYIINQLPNASSYLCAYGATQPSQQAMADVLKGSSTAAGILPVKLKKAVTA